MENKRDALLAGFKAILPILLGMTPFAVIAGVSAVETGLSPIEGIGMSLIVFAGAAQLAGLQLLGQGAVWWVIVMTALIINVRFMLYSASLGPHFEKATLKWKAFLAYFLTDQAYAVSIVEFEEERVPIDLRKWFYFGAGVTAWIIWIIGTAVGALLGAGVPESWQLEFAIPLTFIALLVPAIKNRAMLTAALVSGVLVLLGGGLPYNLGLPLAVVVSIGVGVWLEGRMGMRRWGEGEQGGVGD